MDQITLPYNTTKTYNLSAHELAGRTFYVTSQYSKNTPFKINPLYLFSNEVYVNTWRGRSSSDGRVMGRIKNHIYQVQQINDMLNQNIISETKVK
jgi:hypothetical protein